MKYKVYARCFSRVGNYPIQLEKKARNTKSLYVRYEVINTKTNSLFLECKTSSDVKQVYESFWNDLNPRSKNIVKVTKVIVLN